MWWENFDYKPFCFMTSEIAFLQVFWVLLLHRGNFPHNSCTYPEYRLHAISFIQNYHKILVLIYEFLGGYHLLWPYDVFSRWPAIDIHPCVSQAPNLDPCSLLNQVCMLTPSYLIKTVLKFGFPLGLPLEFERIKMLSFHPKDNWYNWSEMWPTHQDFKSSPNKSNTEGLGTPASNQLI